VASHGKIDPTPQTAAIGDFFLVNPYHFWGEDVWDNEGTGFKHMDVEPVDGYVDSLWADDATFLKKADD